MSEEEKVYESENKAPEQEINKSEAVKEEGKGVVKKEMEPEYGFKPRGPEPTRYGDW